jgi:hypothetical protein
MLAFDPRDFFRNTGAKLRRNHLSVDNACRHLNPLSSVLGMIFSENRSPLFRIML